MRPRMVIVKYYLVITTITNKFDYASECPNILLLFSKLQKKYFKKIKTNWWS